MFLLSRRCHRGRKGFPTFRTEELPNSHRRLCRQPIPATSRVFAKLFVSSDHPFRILSWITAEDRLSRDAFQHVYPARRFWVTNRRQKSRCNGGITSTSPTAPGRRGVVANAVDVSLVSLAVWHRRFFAHKTGVYSQCAPVMSRVVGYATNDCTAWCIAKDLLVGNW